jgi:hypothetical protein
VRWYRSCRMVVIMKTIPGIDLTNVTGGGGKPKLEIPKGGDKGLFKTKKSGKKGTVPAIAEGDFGSSPSNWISIRGD